MYPHEKDESNKKYIIVAIFLHILLIFGIIFFKGIDFTKENQIQENEIPPESSTQDNEIISDENLQLLENKKQEIKELSDNSMKAKSVSAKDVDSAIKNHHNKIAENEARIEKEKNDRIRKAEEAKEKKRLEDIAIKKKIEDEKKEKIKKEQDIKKAELEKEKKLNAEKKKKELEQQAKAEKEKQEKIEKAKLLEEERKRKSAEAIKKAEAERVALLKKKALEASKVNANNRGYDSDKKSLSNDQRLAYLRAYRDQMYNKVYSNWLRPSYSKRGWECVVHITQTKTGQVRNVKIVSCQGDAQFQESVKRAIHKSSPLPLPKHPSLFNETVEIKFKVT